MNDDNTQAPDGQQPPPAIFRGESGHAPGRDSSTHRQDRDPSISDPAAVARHRLAEPTVTAQLAQARADYRQQAAQHVQASQVNPVTVPAQQQVPIRAPQVNPVSAPAPRVSPVPPTSPATPANPAPPADGNESQSDFGGGSAIVVAAVILFGMLVVRSVLTSVFAALLLTLIDAVLVIGYLVFRSQAPAQARAVEAGVLGFVKDILDQIAGLGRPASYPAAYPGQPGGTAVTPGGMAEPVYPGADSHSPGQVPPGVPAAPVMQAAGVGYPQPVQGFGVDGYGRPLSDKSKTTAGLLSILLGAFGAGRFYLGYTGLGIAQIAVVWLTCGIAGIWTTIDGIMMLTGKVPDARGLTLRD